MSQIQALSGARPDPWKGVPVSSQYQQKKLLGWGVGGAPAANGLPERHRLVLDDARHPALRGFAAGTSFNTLVLGAYHLVLQRYLNEIGSVIGCCLLSAGGAATLRPSHAYAEDDESVAAFLAEVDGQLRAANGVETDATDASAWITSRAPAFFFMGAEDGADPLDAPASDRMVMLAAAAPGDSGPAEIRLSMPAAVPVDGEELLRQLDDTLALLLAGGESRVGEVRSRLQLSPEPHRHQMDDMQLRVIALWGHVLGVEAATLREGSSYFEVGGTSLNAFKLVNRVRVEFQRDISIRDIIEYPTVREFSRLLLTR